MHLLAKMLLKVASHRGRRPLAGCRSESAVQEARRALSVAVRPPPSHGSSLHRASMRERQADRRWEEATEAGPEAGRKTKRAEPALPLAQTEDDADSESSEKHGQCVSASQMPTATRVA